MEQSPERKLILLKRILCIGFALEFLLSPYLWISGRLYPTAPLLSFIPVFGYPVDILLFGLLILTLVAIFFMKNPKIALSVFLLLIGYLFLTDQTRLQPWAYQYSLMLLVLVFVSWNRMQSSSFKIALFLLQLIIAMIYILSGLSKINIEFFQYALPWFISPILSHTPQSLHGGIVFLSLLMPLIEIAVGMLLFIPRLHRVGVVLAFCIHVSILLLLGPFGLRWNSIIWPWNIIMILLVSILYWDHGMFYPRLKDINKRMAIIIFIICVFMIVLPITSFWGVWDSYLSFSLYSSNTTYASLYFSKNVKNRLPFQLQHYIFPSPVYEPYRIGFSTWSLDELNVPSYPEERAYKQLARNLCIYSSGNNDIFLVITSKRTFPSFSRKSIVYSCSSLSN